MKSAEILMVEDNADDEELTLLALNKHGVEHPIRVARDGAEALDYLFSTGSKAGRDLPPLPHFILLDLKLPKVSGVEVLRELRRNERTALLPVVVFTSSKEDRDVLDCARLGANSYVRKPVDFSEFSEAVAQVQRYWANLNERPPIPD